MTLACDDCGGPMSGRRVREGKELLAVLILSIHAAGLCLCVAKGFSMKIRAGYEISYDCAQPTPMILTLSVLPSRLPDLLPLDRMRLEPAMSADWPSESDELRIAKASGSARAVNFVSLTSDLTSLKK
jgi:hypothetical protein